MFLSRGCLNVRTARVRALVKQLALSAFILVVATPALLLARSGLCCPCSACPDQGRGHMDADGPLCRAVGHVSVPRVVVGIGTLRIGGESTLSQMLRDTVRNVVRLDVTCFL